LLNVAPHMGVCPSEALLSMFGCMATAFEFSRMGMMFCPSGCGFNLAFITEFSGTAAA